jgi:hypothetical protein
MLIGCETLREWLEARGFRASVDALRSQGNECNWAAYRRTELTARECECNDGKAVQIAVKPFVYTHNGTTYESVSVELTGEVNGLWFTQQAYSLRHDELMSRIDEIERMLIDAWNALLPATETPN